MTLTQLESPRDAGDNFGARIRGYVCPPQTGSYTFRLSGDDDCQLWLSPDDDASRKVQIAGYSGYTDYGQWNKYPGQQSVPVSLEAGRRYYIEALQKEAGGGDFVAVSWQLPDGQTEAPIPGRRLAPFSTPTVGSSLVQASSTLAASKAAVGPELTVYPNPFADHTTLAITSPKSGPVTLAVYDTQSRLVRQIFTGTMTAGEQKRFNLSSQTLAAGMYLVRLVTPGQVASQRITLMP
jgi:hypothetical protein